MSHPPEATDDPFLDDEWLATKGPRSRWRIALWAALAVSVVFLAGAQVQQQILRHLVQHRVGRCPGLPRRSRNSRRRIPRTRRRRVHSHSSSAASDTGETDHLRDRNRHPSHSYNPPGQGLRRHHPHRHDRGPHRHHPAGHPPHRHPARFYHVVIKQTTGSSKHRPAIAITVR